MKLSVSEIAKIIKAHEVLGDPSQIITNVSTIEYANTGSIVFAENDMLVSKAENSSAAAILGPNNAVSTNKTLIKVSEPFIAYINLLEIFSTKNKKPHTVHHTAIIPNSAKIGNNVNIGPYCVVGENVCIEDNCFIDSHVAIGDNTHIGQDTQIYSNVSIYANSKIGKEVIIHANTVIGSDGFGYKFINDHHVKFPHLGNVIIENNVEIGANTAIDRATQGSTIIGQGTKIDNLVQIAHGVKLGQHNILCAFTGIAGSSRSGDRVTFAANVGVSDHVNIDDDVILGARAGVPPNKHLIKGGVYLGNPARPKLKAIEMELAANRIPGMKKQILNLQEKIAKLEKQINLLCSEINSD